MGDYILTCCSTADQSREYFDKKKVRVIFFHCIMDGGNYLDDLGQTIPYNVFYQKMREGSLPTTSQPNVEEFMDFFRPLLDNGNDVLHISTSSGISGEYGSACIAASMLKEEYPENKIYVVDSLTASNGYGLLVDMICEKRDEGMDITTLRDWIEDNKLRVILWLFSTDLTWYVKGGRITRTAGFVGKVLDICPMVDFDVNGHLIPRMKVRTKVKAVQALEKKMEELALGGTDYAGRCFISESDCYDDARKVADLIEDRFQNLKGKIIINSIGSVIGAHTGPGTVGLSFLGEKRVD